MVLCQKWQPQQTKTSWLSFCSEAQLQYCAHGPSSTLFNTTSWISRGCGKPQDSGRHSEGGGVRQRLSRHSLWQSPQGSWEQLAAPPGTPCATPPSQTAAQPSASSSQGHRTGESLFLTTPRTAGMAPASTRGARTLPAWTPAQSGSQPVSKSDPQQSQRKTEPSQPS